MPKAKKSDAAAVAAPVEKKEALEIVYTPEQREEALQAKIASDVQKLPVVDQKISELRERFKDFKIDGVGDKKGYDLAKSSLSELTCYRTATERKAQEITQDYKDVVKGVNGEAKRIIEEIKDIEAPIRLERKKYEEELAAEKKRKEEEEKQKLEDRVAKLKDIGLVFDGQFYALGNVTVDLVTIQKLKEDKFILLCSKASEEAARIEEERQEQERIREEEREKARQEAIRQEQERKRLEDERKELERKAQEQEAELKRMREEAEQQRKELERQRLEQQRELEKLKQEAKERADLLEREKIEAVVSNIGYRLEAIGMRRVGDVYDYFDTVISKGAKFDIKDAVNIKSDDDIAALVSTLELNINSVKDERKQHDVRVEEKRKADEAARKAEEDRIAAEKEALRQAALPDVEKVKSYVSGVAAAAMQCPTRSISNELIAKHLDNTRVKITDLLTELNTSLEAFTK